MHITLLDITSYIVINEGMYSYYIDHSSSWLLVII